MILLSIIAALALNSVVSSGSPLPKVADDCAPIHILSARGSNQPQGEGPTLSPLVDAIVGAHPEASRDSIVWPALILPYDVNSHNGTLAATAALTAYVKKCPDSKIVILGYSQGAHIIGDSLCGGGVTAIVWFGDPRHIGGESYNRGTSRRDGLFGRLPSQSCDYYADRLESYCDTGDFACDRGLDLPVHGEYIPKYTKQALKFVNEKLGQ
ncbi:predicted protein [Uncinocarpus reesii 1704]|uniref:Acetylxylan esterase 2 n=1 Tax=Uncinocarpus reesii (strain UAMH 1704) TaxID=336963 RepID=C4JDS5_UNCRE|nr:uncharacterized protein UREG_00552 [Uncinocarpus reesii 1704]EEP75705.1 predicted protein [Uncinocarpus reesii 1704]